MDAHLTNFLCLFVLLYLPSLGPFSYALELPLTHLSLLKFANEIQRHGDVIYFFAKTIWQDHQKCKPTKTTTTFESRAHLKIKYQFPSEFSLPFPVLKPFSSSIWSTVNLLGYVTKSLNNALDCSIFILFCYLCMFGWAIS